MALRLGILTGGGDCPGLNPAIKWFVKAALDVHRNDGIKPKYEVIGLREGWRSFLAMDPEKIEILPSGQRFHGRHYARFLTEEDVLYWDRLGGTELGTSRTNPAKTDERMEHLVKVFRALNLHALVAIGGEDTLGAAATLHEKYGLNIIGIPKTIDKDLPGTDYTLGFETAVNIITEEVDRIRTTAGSHSRIFVVETMGRHAGHLALQGGLACGAYIILIPEHPFNIGRVISLLVERKMKGIRYSIVIVSEGAYPEGMGLIVRQDSRDTEYDHPTLGGVGEFLANQIEKATNWEVRSIVLSHLQRGGVPSAFDVRMARLFGTAAVDLIDRGEFGKLVSYIDGSIKPLPISVVKSKLNLVNVERDYDTIRYNGKRRNIIS